MLSKIQLTPGLFREGTNYSNEGAWYDADFVRFRYGYPENIGGWAKVNLASFSGTCRFLHPFITLDSDNYLFVGTSTKAYLEDGGAMYDITPVRGTVTLGSNPLTSGAASGGEVTVSHALHGAIVGDSVTFSSATAFDGLTTADLNKEHIILTVPDANTYTVDTGGSSTVGSVSGGGASISAEYLLSIGLDVSILGVGFGAGTWGRFTWGSSSGYLTGQTLRLWFADAYGEDLVFNVADAGIYYWDATSGTGTRATNLTSISGASDVPTIARRVIVSDIDRHVIAFGANTMGTNTQDPLLIRWADQENIADWTPTDVNTSGSIRLSQGSSIISALRTKREILVWTDSSLHSLQYIGPPYIFGQNLIGENVKIVGPNAAVNANDQVFWMGKENFYRYDGTINDLPCSVRSYVFDDINRNQSFKIFCGSLASHNEVWWFYPSAASSENDRYVCYNYLDNLWVFGSLARTAWIDRGSGQRSYPQATAIDGFVYNQEYGLDDGSTSPDSNINSYIESADFDIGDGYKFMLIRRVIPDITFDTSTAITPTVTFSMKVKDYPGVAVSETGSGTATRTSSSPVEVYTKTIPIRARGRAAALRVENTTTGVKWRVGGTRIEMRPDGRK